VFMAATMIGMGLLLRWSRQHTQLPSPERA